MTYWSGVVDTMYHQQRQDADIILFGDSTSAINVDPVRMSKDLHLKVLVLPNLATTLPVIGYDPLEEYLRANKQPRLIVFYLSAWDLNFMHDPFTPIVEEGVEMLLLHESWAKIFHYAFHHPEKMLMFPLHFYAAANGPGDLLYLREHDTARVEQGHILNLPYPKPMKQSCIFDPKLFAKGFKDTTVREAISRFTRPGTQAMVFIAPLPNCKDIDLITSAQHPGLDIPPIQVLPPEDFREDSWQAHMLPGKIGPSTDYLESAIRQRLQPLAGNPPH